MPKVRLDPAEAHAAIVRFLGGGRRPALLEPGEDQFPLEPGSYALDWRNGRLMLQVWDQRRNMARRIVGLAGERAGRLELTVERFGKQLGQLYLLDTASPRCTADRSGARLMLREHLRMSLSRQYPDWKIAELSAEANLEESLSPAYPRAFLKRGEAGIAAIAAPNEPGAAAAALTFGLVWLDYLRRREQRVAVAGLALFLPEREAHSACHRLPFLDPRAVQVQAFACSPAGREERLDPDDYGNVETTLEPCRDGVPASSPFWERLARLPSVETVRRPGGVLSLRVHGVEFARCSGGDLVFGLEKKAAVREANLPEVERLARELARLRSAAAPDRDSPLYRAHPEAWLESEVRAHLEEIDATLLARPVYGQVPAMAGCDRGVLDLLALDRSGRLVVLELKASEDIHLPLQSLDYWIRVVWHLERGEFSARGYFPGFVLRRERPRLVLIAPALGFHPKTEVILRFFQPGIEVERIGLGADWRREPRVMFRAKGAERPMQPASGECRKA